MRAVGYVRVSTDEQAGSGVSLEMQAEKVRQYAALHSLELVDVVSDPGASAKSLDRPGLRSALDRLKSGEASGLVILKLDRLTRNVRDLTTLVEDYFGPNSGRSLMSVSESIDTGSAAGRMTLNLLTTIAQWERETIVERTRSAMAHKRSRGERLGQVPFGKRVGPDGRTLIDDDEELKTIDVMQRCRENNLSYRDTADVLNNLVRPTKKGGGKWSPSSVRAILARTKEKIL